MVLSLVVYSKLMVRRRVRRIALAIWTPYRNVTDRRTHRQTDRQTNKRNAVPVSHSVVQSRMRRRGETARNAQFWVLTQKFTRMVPTSPRNFCRYPMHWTLADIRYVQRSVFLVDYEFTEHLKYILIYWCSQVGTIFKDGALQMTARLNAIDGQWRPHVSCTPVEGAW